MRMILVVHRYLAVAVGALMTLWCLSGFVMMYQGFPSVSGEERRAGLESLDLTDCCDLGALASSVRTNASFRLEMLLGDPVLRTGRGSGGGGALNLRTGLPVGELSPEEVLEVAERFAAGNGIDGTPRFVRAVEIDQWTIQTARRNQPAYRIAFDDAGANEVYVSGASGEVFQATGRKERFLGWLGAIPHWLYPTLLRRNGPLWTEIVIWTSILGTFLAATGLYVGIARLKRRRQNNRLASPFRGWWYWHHISGLAFGVLALTWVFSGLMTMNPWGALTGGGGRAYSASMGGTVESSDVRLFLESAVANSEDIRQYRQLQSAPFGGDLYVTARGAENGEVRLGIDARRVADLTENEVAEALAALEVELLEFSLIEKEDSYYYGHKRDVELPVYRLILDDVDETRLYVAPGSGEISTVNATRRASRWIRTGLHDFDFAGLRVRPVWDIVVILLLAGVTLLCGTGTWMAWKRVKRDLRALGRRIARGPRRTQATATQAGRSSGL